MAENVTLNPVVTFTNDTSAVNTVNSNYTTITNALTDVLSRSGVSPNQMQSNLDMNSNQILNLPPPATTNSPARLVDVVSNPTITVPPVGTSGATVPLLNGNNTWSGTNTFSIGFANSSLATMPAGTVKANPTGGVATPIDWQINASTSVASTGIPGLNNQQFFIYHTPSTVVPSTAQATLRVDRVPTYTGGTPSNVFNAIFGFVSPSSGVADAQWAILGEIQNNATAGQNVALAGAAFANSTGPTWAMDLIMRDTFSTTSALVNSVTAEMDMFANGTDATNRRVILDFVLGMQNTSGAAVHVSRGLGFTGNDASAANDIYDIGIQFANSATFGTCIDMSAAPVTNFAMHLADSQKICLDTAGTRTLHYQSGQLSYTTSSGSVTAFQVSDTGLSQFGSGGFTANGTGAAVTFGATTPAAIGTPATVNKWLTVVDNLGNTLYIPAWH